MNHSAGSWGLLGGPITACGRYRQEHRSKSPVEAKQGCHDSSRLTNDHRRASMSKRQIRTLLREMAPKPSVHDGIHAECTLRRMPKAYLTPQR